MLVLGHAGITLGTAILLAGGLASKSLPKARGNEAVGASHPSPLATATTINHPTKKVSWLAFLASRIDIRVLLVGSLLPDIIDKPVGHFFFRDIFNNGRILSHTLLFSAALALAGVYLYRRRGQNWLLVLSSGTFTHLILDRMWQNPRTFFWPLYGLTFEVIDTTNWIQNLLHALITDPSVYVPELVGLGVLIWFVHQLVRRKTFCDFVRRGQIY